MSHPVRVRKLGDIEIIGAKPGGVDVARGFVKRLRCAVRMFGLTGNAIFVCFSVCPNFHNPQICVAIAKC